MSNYILQSTGDTPTCGPNQTYRADVTWAGAKGQCLTDAQYAECKSTGKLVGQPCSVASGGGVVDAVKSVVGSIFGIWGQSKVAQGQAQAYQTMAQQQAAANATPSWLMPVAIGGAALAIVLLMKKRKNPARRRRARRNSASGSAGSVISTMKSRQRKTGMKRKRGFVWRGKHRTHGHGL